MNSQLFLTRLDFCLKPVVRAVYPNMVFEVAIQEKSTWQHIKERLNIQNMKKSLGVCFFGLIAQNVLAF